MARKKRNKNLGAGALEVPMMKKTVGTTLVNQSMHYQHGYFEGPDAAYLQDYEVAARRDPIISRAVDYIVRSMVSSIGPYVNKDPRAVAFVEEMLATMDGNFYQQMGELITSGIWSGFGLSEKVFEVRKNKVWLKRLANYHPRSLTIVPNGKGELTDGEPIHFHPRFKKSGIYQELPWQDIVAGNVGQGVKRRMEQNYIRIPLDKVVLVTHNKRHGNWAGESALAPIWLRYQMALETWQNLMITTERYGSPQLALIVPYGQTSQKVDQGDGTFRYKTLAEAGREALTNLNASSALVFEEPVGAQTHEKVRLQNVSTFNNFGESFLSTITHLYGDILVGLGVPALLFMEHSEGLGSGAISQVHAETYKQLLVSLYKEFVEPFCEQVIGQLLKYNFGITDPGSFIFTPFDITAGQTLMETFGEANVNGVLDFSEEEDLQFARAKLGFPLASESSIKRRISNNKKLMEVIRRPETDKMTMGRENNKASLEATKLQVDAQDKMNKRQVQAQKEITDKNNEVKMKVDRAKAKMDLEKSKMQHEQIMSGQAHALEAEKAKGAVMKAKASSMQQRKAKQPAKKKKKEDK